MIYFDGDDVLADFTGYVNKVLKTELKIGETMSDANWNELRKYHQRMFADLKVNESARELLRKVSSVTKGNVAILTAIPDDIHSPWQYATMDKINWYNKHFPGVPVFIGPYPHDKKRHCKIGDTLIDDRYSNCDEWRAASGFAHLYRTAEAAEEWLHDERHLVFYS